MLHTTTRGSGDPVLVLHSSGLSSRQWGALAAELAKTHEVLAPDLLGYGANPPLPDPETFTLADELDAIVELLPKAPTHIIGHSYGGLLALMVARSYPSRVRSVGVFDPVAFGVLFDANDSTAIADFDTIRDIDGFRDATRGGDERWLRMFIDYWNGGPTWDGLPQQSRDAFLHVGRKAFFEVMQVIADRTPRAAYAAVIAPTLILMGERSPLAARRTAEHLASAIPKARLEVIPGAGHMGPLTHGSRVNAALIDHVSRA